MFHGATICALAIGIIMALIGLVILIAFPFIWMGALGCWAVAALFLYMARSGFLWIS